MKLAANSEAAYWLRQVVPNFRTQANRGMRGRRAERYSMQYDVGARRGAVHQTHAIESIAGANALPLPYTFTI
jgi:hypothetical protein